MMMATLERDMHNDGFGSGRCLLTMGVQNLDHGLDQHRICPATGIEASGETLTFSPHMALAFLMIQHGIGSHESPHLICSLLLGEEA
jgi:hypothetical protein